MNKSGVSNSTTVSANRMSSSSAPSSGDNRNMSHNYDSKNAAVMAAGLKGSAGQSHSQSLDSPARRKGL
jgi:hypothetical protein